MSSVNKTLSSVNTSTVLNKPMTAFNAVNPIDAETIAQIDQELLESELNSGSDDTDTLVDQTSHEESAIDDVHEADIDLEVEVELVEYGINDMVDGGSIDTYSMEGV